MERWRSCWERSVVMAGVNGIGVVIMRCISDTPKILLFYLLF